MVVPTAPYYYGDVIRGARAAMSEAKGRLVIGITNYDLDEERAQIRRMHALGVHALLLTPAWPTGTSPDSEADRAARLGVPTVLVERRGALGSRVGELDRVCSAHAGGCFLAVRHLTESAEERGLDSPRLAHGQPSWNSVSTRRLSTRACRSPPAWCTTRPQPEPAEIEAALDAVVERAGRGEVDAAVVHTDHDAVQFWFQAVTPVRPAGSGRRRDRRLRRRARGGGRSTADRGRTAEIRGRAGGGPARAQPARGAVPDLARSGHGASASSRAAARVADTRVVRSRRTVRGRNDRTIKRS